MDKENSYNSGDFDVISSKWWLEREIVLDKMIRKNDTILERYCKRNDEILERYIRRINYQYKLKY